MSNEFSLTRLALIKSLLNNDKDIDLDKKNILNDALTTTQIWHTLFQYKLFIPFKAILAEGIYPTVKELNECCLPQGVCAWHVLASNCDKQAFEIFEHLMGLGFLPSAACLNSRRATDNTSTWWWLAASSYAIVIFQALIDKNILPSAKALNACRRSDNRSTWWWLAAGYSPCSVFQTLLDRGVLPSAESLNERSFIENTSTWWWLAICDLRIPLFQTLLDKRIFPSSQSLSECHPDENLSTWFGLVMNDYRMTVFKCLLDNGILPSSSTLNIQRKADNTPAWFWLAKSKSGIAIFQRLINKNILPSNSALNAIDSEEAICSWFWLASSDEQALVFQDLLGLGIIPAANALDSRLKQGNTSTWWNLVQSDTRFLIFQILLNKEILPSSKALNSFSKSDYTSVWFWLAKPDYVALFGYLRKKDLIPSDKALNQPEKNRNLSAWYYSNSGALNLRLFQELVDHHILPPFQNKPINLYDERLKLKDNHTIAKRLTALNDLKSAYDIDPNSEIAVFLSREDKSNIYGFLFLFYMVAYKKDKSPEFPEEIWFEIAQYILPFLTRPLLTGLRSERNRTAFVKYHVMNALDTYIDKQHMLWRFFPNQSLDRAKRLKETITKHGKLTTFSDNDEQLKAILKEGYTLSLTEEVACDSSVSKP